MSIQVQIRRDTTTNLSSFKPAQGELIMDTTRNECFLGDGTNTVGSGNLTSSTRLPSMTVNGNATASSASLFQCKSQYILFDYIGGNGAGNQGVQVTIDKASATESGSFLFQTAYSARAQIGLLGDDEFSVKVSPDNANYYKNVRGWKDLHGRTDVKNAARRVWAEWTPQPGSVTYNQLGLGQTTATNAFAIVPSAGNYYLQSWRVGYATMVAAGTNGGTSAISLPVWMGNSPGLGGFYFRIRGGIETFQSNMRMFFGLLGSIGLMGNVNPSSLTNIIGIGFDSGQTTLHLLCSGATPSAGIDLGANFPVTGSQDMYELLLSCEPNGTSMNYRVERLNSGNVATGTLSTNLPANTTFLGPQVWVNNGTTAAAAQIGFGGMYLENASALGSRGNL